MPSLKRLYWNHNGVTRVPDGLARLSTLQQLDLRGNRIAQLTTALNW